MQTPADLISLTIDDGVATATLARPPVNAIDDAWIARLLEVVQAAESHGARALLIRSKERTFSAGADLALMRSRFDSAAGRLSLATEPNSPDHYAKGTRSPNPVRRLAGSHRL